MHIHVTGSGPALVLIHGWALHGGIFAPLVEAIAKARDVVLYQKSLNTVA